MIDVNTMYTLENLGFSKTRVSEVLLTLNLGGEVNAAPMGVRLSKHGLPIIRVYAGSRTYIMIKSGAKDYVLNVTSDPEVFYWAVLKKEYLRFKSSRRVTAPRIAGCQAYVECVLESIKFGRNYLRAELRPVYIEYVKVKPKAYCRAQPAIIEALVYFTKLKYLLSVGDLSKAKALLENIKHCENVVRHCTTQRKLRKIAKEILVHAEELVR